MVGRSTGSLAVMKRGQCPNCQRRLLFLPALRSGKLQCPKCGATLKFQSPRSAAIVQVGLIAFVAIAGTFAYRAWDGLGLIAFSVVAVLAYVSASALTAYIAPQAEHDR